MADARLASKARLQRELWDYFACGLAGKSIAIARQHEAHDRHAHIGPDIQAHTSKAHADRALNTM